MLDVRLFGKFEVSQDGRPVEIASRPVHSLLAYLILNAGVMVRREKVAGLLWPDSEEDNARHNLRQALWRLGKVIGKKYFLTDKVSVSFDSRADYTLDVATLLEEVTEEGTADQLIRSVSVYTDTLLPGFYDDWVLLEQDRLQAIYENRMQLLLERLATEKRWRENREWAEMWIAQGRVPEAAYRALMTALAALGDRAGVSAVYQRCIEALKAEVGVEPSAETQDLYQRISSGKNLTELQEPPTRERITVRLPIQPTPFIGRKNDLKELSALLSDPNIRLINIQGLGGIGKTRLAIETASSKRDSFADGVFFVPLAALDDPNLIETSIRSVIQISSQAKNQLGRNHQYKQLLYYLRDKKLLLVLDNLEHLLDGLSIISDILRSAPGVKIFTTSRQRLNLRGETVYTLDSMPVPVKTSEVAALMGQTNDAVQLFINSARLAQPKFELAADNLDAVIRVC